MKGMIEVKREMIESNKQIQEANEERLKQIETREYFIFG